MSLPRWIKGRVARATLQEVSVRVALHVREEGEGGRRVGAGESVLMCSSETLV